MNGGDAIDATVTEFLELEAELEAGSKTARTYAEGTVAHASKVSAEKVPADYPVEIRTRDALELGVTVEDGATVPTYLEWPGDDEDSDQLFRLLDALGRDPGEFADLYGDHVALDAEDGWHSVDIEGTATIRGMRTAASDESLDTTRNLLMGTVAAGVVGLLLTLSTETLGPALVTIVWVALPLLIFVDVRRIGRTSGWSPSTAGWIIPGAVPVLNPAVGVAYLLHRHVRLAGAVPGDVPATWRNAIITASILPVLGFGLVEVSASVASVAIILGWTFLPIAVSIDARYVDEATDWDQYTWVWTATVAITATVGAVVYLLIRRGALRGVD